MLSVCSLTLTEQYLPYSSVLTAIFFSPNLAEICRERVYLSNSNFAFYLIFSRALLKDFESKTFFSLSIFFFYKFIAYSFLLVSASSLPGVLCVAVISSAPFNCLHEHFIGLGGFVWVALRVSYFQCTAST